MKLHRLLSYCQVCPISASQIPSYYLQSNLMENQLGCAAVKLIVSFVNVQKVKIFEIFGIVIGKQRLKCFPNLHL